MPKVANIFICLLGIKVIEELNMSFSIKLFLIFSRSYLIMSLYSFDSLNRQLHELYQTITKLRNLHNPASGGGECGLSFKYYVRAERHKSPYWHQLFSLPSSHSFPYSVIIIIIRFLINVQGHHPHQWAPFQVTG